LPEDTFLVAHIDHEALAASPHRDLLRVFDGVLVETALSLQVPRPSEPQVPEDVLSGLHYTTHVITMDVVGLSDSLTVFHGDFPSDAIAELLDVGDETERDALGWGAAAYGPLAGASDAVDTIAIHMPEEGLSIGPADRRGAVETLLDPARDPTSPRSLSELVARSASAAPVSIYLANGPGLSDYLRAVFGEQNLGDAIVDTFVGGIARLELRDTVSLDFVVVASDEPAAVEIGDQVDQLLAGLEQHPLLHTLGLDTAVVNRTRQPEGDAVRFSLRANRDTFRKAFNWLLDMLASDGSAH
jgi:hypothetical protein